VDGPADFADGGQAEGGKARHGVEDGEEVREAQVAVDAFQAVPLIAQRGVDDLADLHATTSDGVDDGPNRNFGNSGKPALPAFPEIAVSAWVAFMRRPPRAGWSRP
jgi:hypothetical protein